MKESRTAITDSQTYVATQASLGHALVVAGHLMPGRGHRDINSDCPPVDTRSSSGLRKFGIEQRQIIRDLQTPQMPLAAGSNSSGNAGACRKASRTKWFALAQSLNSFAPCASMSHEAAGNSE
ncbi:unnamed protein product [Polarella glacialis]|uniref:Uncharacterized protein n=1 Tax=Polarella glacialis TaxID=89957 RepID=A0A813IMF5_POLGL|nr:unnamed protein product [Polarella glacialis]